MKMADETEPKQQMSKTKIKKDKVDIPKGMETNPAIARMLSILQQEKQK